MYGGSVGCQTRSAPIRLVFRQFVVIDHKRIAADFTNRFLLNYCFLLNYRCLLNYCFLLRVRNHNAADWLKAGVALQLAARRGARRWDSRLSELHPEAAFIVFSR
jgi:hypothetical protein